MTNLDMCLIQLSHEVRYEVAEDYCDGDAVYFYMLLNFVEDVDYGEMWVQARLQLYFSQSDSRQEEEHNEHVYVGGDDNNIRFPIEYVEDPFHFQIFF